MNLTQKMNTGEILSETTVATNPFQQFDRWYTEHLSHGFAIPEFMFLATAAADGKVSLRTVLLKDYTDGGFAFYTNYGSRKASQLEENSNAAILFYWAETARQVRIEGRALKIPAALSDEYFRTRARESQLSAWASKQSSVIPGRVYLEKRIEEYTLKFEGLTIPRPRYWGGYRIIPEMFEFWQDRENRVHDRIVYERDGSSWKIKRLAP